METSTKPMKQQLKMNNTLAWSLRLCHRFYVLSLLSFFVAYYHTCSRWQITTSIIEKRGVAYQHPLRLGVTPQNCS